jgi:hypothetical protein
VATDDRPAYVCQDCHARWQTERRESVAPLKYGERRAPDAKKRFS